MAAAVLVLCLGGASLPASATHTVSGLIELPCANPTLRKLGVEECGWQFTLPAHGLNNSYRVRAARAADLDIHFYDASDTFITANPGPGALGIDCTDLIGDVPTGAVRAVVVLTPSTCGGTNGQSNVGATYTSTP